MRYLFVAIMIILLPLRGWAGQSMAVDMAAQQLVMAIAVATSAETAPMPPDCPMLAGSGAEMEHTDTAAADLHCDNCNTCQLCLTLGSLTHAPLPAQAFVPFYKPQTLSIQFLSADTAPGHKPPIS